MRVPFAVPDQVLWKDLSSVLSYWYMSKTGSCLSFDHLQIIAAKLFGNFPTFPLFLLPFTSWFLLCLHQINKLPSLFLCLHILVKKQKMGGCDL